MPIHELHLGHVAVRPNVLHRQPLLGHLDIELTERCNNACQHCYINLPEEDCAAASRELTTSQWLGILHQAADLGALSVRFTGGEPLLRPDFSDLYLAARRLGMKVYIFTNARLITPELAALWARIPPLMKLEVTVYGMHADSYDAVSCTPGAFGEFQRGISLLQEYKVPFCVKSVILPPNQAERAEFEAWAVTLPGMQGLTPSYSCILDLRTRRDSPARNRHIANLRMTSAQVLAFVSQDEAVYRKGMAQFFQNFSTPPNDRLFTCDAGAAGCVDAYGSYQMCMLLRHPETTYSLLQGTLREALTSFFPRLRELRVANPEYLRRCARCFLRGLCEQCPAKSWAEYGTLDTPVEYLCQVAHLQARYLGLLGESEHTWEVVDWRTRLDRFVSHYRN